MSIVSYLGERFDKMQERLRGTPLSAFTADYTFDICIVMDPDFFDDLQTETHGRSVSVEDSLERLEKFFKNRERELKKKKKKGK